MRVKPRTLQELQMLSSVTLDGQVTKNVMNSGSQLSELQSVSQKSQGKGSENKTKIGKKNALILKGSLF